MAVQASRTVSLRFDDHFVPVERLGRTEPFDTFVASEARGSVMNGFLALGVAGRCDRLLGADDLDTEIADARIRLPPRPVTRCRKRAPLPCSPPGPRPGLVQTGSRSVSADEHAGGLYRASRLLLVFGLRPAIKDGLLRRLSTPVNAPVAFGRNGPEPDRPEP